MSLVRGVARRYNAESSVSVITSPTFKGFSACPSDKLVWTYVGIFSARCGGGHCLCIEFTGVYAFPRGIEQSSGVALDLSPSKLRLLRPCSVAEMD